MNQWKFDSERYPNAVFAASHVVNIPTDTRHPEKVLTFLDKNSSLIMDATLGGRVW